MTHVRSRGVDTGGWHQGREVLISSYSNFVATIDCFWLIAALWCQMCQLCVSLCEQGFKAAFTLHQNTETVLVKWLLFSLSTLGGPGSIPDRGNFFSPYENAYVLVVAPPPLLDFPYCFKPPPPPPKKKRKGKKGTYAWSLVLPPST